MSSTNSAAGSSQGTSSLQIIGNTLMIVDSNGNYKLPSTANGNLKIAGSTFVNSSLAVSGATALCAGPDSTLAFFGSNGSTQPEIVNSNMTEAELAGNTTALSKMIISMYEAMKKLGLVK